MLSGNNLRKVTDRISGEWNVPTTPIGPPLGDPIASLAGWSAEEDIDRMVNRDDPPTSGHPRAGQISGAAADLLRAVGLTEWSIEACAKAAKCAKGLVLHHHRTKEQLLTTVARDLSAARWRAWRQALAAGDVSVIDALYDRLAREHADRSGRALIELRLAGFEGTLLGPEELTELTRLLARALDITVDELPVPDVLEPLLEGYLLALQRNASAEDVREAFLRYWLSYVK